MAEPATTDHPRLYAELCEEYATTPGVSVPDGERGFGSQALKINGAIGDSVDQPGAHETAGHGHAFRGGRQVEHIHVKKGSAWRPEEINS